MKRLIGWIVFVVFILVLIIIFIGRSHDLADIRRDGVLIKAQIVDVVIPSKGGMPFSFRCSFSYNGVQKELISPTSVKEHPSRYNNKICPAVYSPGTNNIRLLLTPDDFEEYNVPITDSLTEVINRLNQ